MSFREKHLWISLVASVAVWGYYFFSVGAAVWGGGLTQPGFVGQTGQTFVFCLVAVVLLEVILTFIATATTPKVDKARRDERELACAYKGSHVALMVVIALFGTLALVIYVGGLVGGNLVDGRTRFGTDVNLMVLLANLVIGFLVLAEVIRAAVTLVLLKGLR